MARGRQKRVITTEMIADISVLSKDDYCAKHNCGEMFFLNMYYKCVSPKDEEPKFFDIFEEVLIDTDILYEKGAVEWLKHVSAKQSELDVMVQDILHKVQLDTHTDAEKIRYFDMLRDIRINRCNYTDALDFYNTNKHKIIDLIGLMEGIASRKKFLKERVYKVRKLATEFGKSTF